MTITYVRASRYECEELEGEFAIMELDSRAMVMLNPAGQMVWDAIEHRITLDDLEAAFRDAFPDMGRDTIRHDIQGVLDALVAANLALISEE